MQKTFSKFTNQYSLSKTLRFELRPTEATKKMLVDNGVFAEDENKKKAYIAIKPYFDRLHREFVAESLEKVEFRKLKEYENIFKEWDFDRKNQEKKKKLEEAKGELRKQIGAYFDATGKTWADEKYKHLKLKKKDLNILFENEIFAILKDRFGEETETKIKDEKTGEEISIFDQWNGFGGYFTKFHETRKNFYTTNGKASALATRIVDQSLSRFLENLKTIARLQGKIDFTEVENYFGKKASEVFSLQNYNNCILQAGIDQYNDFLGGKTLENGDKKQGINELINEYRQNHKGDKLSYLKKLDKQILSEKDKKSFGIETEEEFLKILHDFHKNAKTKIEIFKNLFDDLAKNFSSYDLDKIYLSKEAFNTISRKWTNETTVWQENLFEVLKAKKLVKAKKKDEEEFAFPDFISLESLKESLEKFSEAAAFWKDRYYENEENERGFLNITEKPSFVQFMLIFENEIKDLFEKEIEKDNGEKIKIGFDISKQKIEKFLAQEKIKIGKEEKIVIKEFADDVLRIYQMAKYFALEKNRGWNEEYQTDDFYTKIKTGYLAFYDDAYRQIVGGYNDLRNYLTKKAYSEEKWKLNFENPTLADGWDKNKESANSAIILKKDGGYFLGLMKKGCNQLFDQRNEKEMKSGLENGSYEKMVYKFIKDIVTGIPKSSTQMKEVVEHFKKSNEDCIVKKGSSIGMFRKPLVITKEIFNLNNRIFSKNDLKRSVLRGEISEKEEKNYIKLFQKDFVKLGGDFAVYQKSLYVWIDFCKNFLESYPSCSFFDYSKLKEASQYQSLDEFYDEINNLSYVISFEKVSQYYIEKENQEGKLYLFEIFNQDFADGKTGKKNLHTMYWEALFSPENMAQNFSFKLNGQAEIFYRPKSIEIEKEQRNFSREITKNKRYTENKIFFHCPLTLNRTKSDAKKFNDNVNNFLAKNPNINIIGVDRGEKHLAYYSVINQKQEILESGSLNELNGVDYGKKLEEKAGHRKFQRQDWSEVENIKDLKKGYISQVVRKLADLAIRHNAIIVFEDLNMRFKQIRGGIEKSVYQQLEKALIDKLNFLVEKGEADPEKAGHLLKAYQLAAPFESFKEMGKQTGIIFYTQASYTSKIDPLTGWRPNLYLKYVNAEKTQKEIEEFFKSIKFNQQENYFEFEYELKNTKKEKGDKKNEVLKKTTWVLGSNVERYLWSKKNTKNGEYKHYNELTANFKELFYEFTFDIDADILAQIKKLDPKQKQNAKFFKDFVFLWKLLCQIRNTQKEKEGDENDFILSPVAPFFDSRKAQKSGKNLPKNGDDNGAFNIARKGILILQRISEKPNGKVGWAELSISQIAWDNFAQSKFEKK